MSLFVYQSNRLERLVQRLASVTHQPLSSPFVTEQIVVETQGMAQWLRLELAGMGGIVANLALPFPRAFISGLIRTVVPAEAQSGAIEPEALTWRVMGRLGALLKQPEFDQIRNYLSTSDDPRRKFQLAERIATLLDQYSVYRPHWIAAWQSGQDATPPLGEQAHWQAALWRAVMTDGLACQGKFLYELIQSLSMPGRDCAALPERLSVMVTGSLPPSYLAVFEALARHIPVHLFCFCPCREYWGDVVTPWEADRIQASTGGGQFSPEDLHLGRLNPLLASCGKTGRGFQQLVTDLDQAEEVGDDFVDPGAAHLLARVQASILGLEEVPEDRPIIQRNDRSIQVHACHSPLRELQVLRDQLLDWFATDSTLSPADVLVMLADMEAYAPYIKGVFETAEPGAPAIPFTLAGRGARQESALTDGFLSLLQLSFGRLPATAVTDLFETPAVRRRFGVAEEELAQVRLWIQNAAIRWGRDGQHRSKLGLPAFKEHTWDHGCNRLLLGYAMADGQDALVHELLPCEGIEGTATSLLGRWLDFLKQLFAALDELATPRTLESWAATLNQLLDALFLTLPEEERAAHRIRQVLETLRQQQRVSGFDDRVPLSVVLERLVPQLEADQPGSAFLNGTMTFCGLGPMRGIPYKAVCLLGMQDGSFPRNPAPPSFDLMAQHPQLGDESRRDDDRYLFLQSLLSARERFYVSYVGQSVRDNTPRPPSVVVSELLDFIGAQFRLEETPETAGGDEPAIIKDLLLTVHRLHAFSPAYFRQGNGSDPRLFGYSPTLAQVSRILVEPSNRPRPEAFLSQSLPAIDRASTNVTLHELQSFYRNPSRVFVERSFEFKLPEDKELLLDEEPFAVDGLEAYHCKQAVLDAHLNGSPLSRLLPAWRGAGKLPPGPAGILAGNGFMAGVSPMLSRIQERIGQARAEARPFQLKINSFTFEGELGVFPGVGLVHYRAAKVDPKKKGEAHLKLWIEHLVLQLLGQETQSVLMGQDQTWLFSPVPEAEKILGELLDLYCRGLTAPLPFFPKSGFTYVIGPGPQTHRPAEELASEVWEGNEDYESEAGEKEEPYFHLCFRNHPDPLGPDFQQLARQVVQPILAHATEVKSP
jgi:exodeoxyribonuclease V gamma subunit